MPRTLTRDEDDPNAPHPSDVLEPSTRSATPSELVASGGFVPCRGASQWTSLANLILSSIVLSFRPYLAREAMQTGPEDTISW